MIPRARKTDVVGMRGDSLLVRLASPPVDGAANHALIAFLAATFGVPRRAIVIISGERGRQKRIAIAGVTAAHVKALLSRSPGTPRVAGVGVRLYNVNGARRLPDT